MIIWLFEIQGLITKHYDLLVMENSHLKQCLFTDKDSDSQGQPLI